MSQYKKKQERIKSDVHLLENEHENFTKCNLIKNPDIGFTKYSLEISEITCHKCLNLPPEKRIIEENLTIDCNDKQHCKCRFCKFASAIKKRVLEDKRFYLKTFFAKQLSKKYYDEYLSIKIKENEYKKFNNERLKKETEEKNQRKIQRENIKKTKEELLGKNSEHLDLNQKLDKNINENLQDKIIPPNNINTWKDVKNLYDEMFNKIFKDLSDDMYRTNN